MINRTYSLSLLLALLVASVAAGCSSTAPCAICYEDEWSREPFPGQPKQHIKPLTPESVSQTPSAVSPVAHEFLGVSAGEDMQPF